MLDRLISVAVAIILGFLVWLYARSRDQEMLDNVPVPVTIVLASNQAEKYDLEVTGPAQIIASFSGPPSRIRELRGLIQRGGLRVQTTMVVPEDRLNEARYLDTVRVDAADLHPPPGVRAIVAEGRNRIPVTLRQLVERRLPVRLDYTPDEPASQVIVEPAKVSVRGPRDILDRLRAVPTQPFARPNRSDSSGRDEQVTTTTVALVQELEGRPIKTAQSHVTVRLTLRARQQVYEVVDVPVYFLCPADFAFRPQWVDARSSKISLKLEGPEGEDAPLVTAFVDLTQRQFEAGLDADEPLRLQLPRGYQLAQPPPRSASFHLKPLSSERMGQR
jgi:hypothetical protein